MTNLVSAELSDDTLSKIHAGIDELEALMPFLISLSSDERKGMAKLGDKSKAFVDKATEAALQYAELLPRSLDVNELKKDTQLFDQLYSVNMALRGLLDKVESTLAIAGSEAYAGALLTYQSLKYQGKSTELEAVVDELGKRFARKSG